MSDSAQTPRELAHLYESFAHKAFRYARGMGVSEADAEDIVSDCFLRVAESYGTFRADASFSTWLLAMVRNAVLNALRNGRRHAQIHERLRTDPATHDGPEDAAMKKEYLAAMGEAIAGLAPENRSALSLVVLAGLSLKDAASIEDITEPALSSRLFVARKAVRTYLAARQLLES